MAPTGVLQESQKGFCLADEDELCLPLAQALQLEALGTVWTESPLPTKSIKNRSLKEEAWCLKGSKEPW